MTLDLRSGWPRVTPAFTAETCPARDPAEEITEVHADLTAALQKRTEQVIAHLARRARSLTGSERLCVAGGVAMNCVGIGKVIGDGLFEEVYVPPAPGDSGTAIGAALSAYLDATGVLEGGPAGSCYLGPSYPGFIPESPPGMSARQFTQPGPCRPGRPRARPAGALLERRRPPVARLTGAAGGLPRGHQRRAGADGRPAAAHRPAR